MRFKLSFFLFILLGFSIITQTVAEEAPDILLKRVTKEMITSLRQNDAELQRNPNRIYVIINQILVPHIEWRTMAQWVVGRNVWMSSSESQRSRFSNEFRDLLIRTYASTLRAYNNQTIEYMPIRGGIEGKSRVQVISFIRESGREPIRVTYRLVKQRDQWLVYDISIEGVSLLKGFQSQFAEELQHSGIEAVIARLHQHNEKPLRQ